MGSTPSSGHFDGDGYLNTTAGRWSPSILSSPYRWSRTKEPGARCAAAPSCAELRLVIRSRRSLRRRLDIFLRGGMLTATHMCRHMDIVRGGSS